MQQLTQGITPERIALTVALGVVLGLFPLIGTTSLLCFLAAWALRLNQPVIQLVNQLLWPLHLAFILPCIRVGEKVMRAPHETLELSALNHAFWHAPAQFLARFGSAVGHSLLGWLILAPPLGLVVHILLRPVLRRAQRLSLPTRGSST